MPRRPSVQARLAAVGLTYASRLPRMLEGTRRPDPSLSQEELERYALRLRVQIEGLAAYQRLPRRVSVREDADAPVAGEWVADTNAGDRTVLHIHGGAYCLCSPRTHRGLTATLSRTAHARVFVPAYRLAPEHRFPAALDDVVAAYRWLVEDGGVPPGSLAVTGDSAGGGLALSMLVRLRDEGVPLPAAYVGMSPWTDLAATGASYVDNRAVDWMLPAQLVPAAARGYAGDVPLDHPLVSPLYADLSGLPPMLVHVGSDELLLDDGRELVHRAREAGVDASYGVFHGMWHVFQAFPWIPERVRAMREIGGFIRRHTDAPWRRAGP